MSYNFNNSSSTTSAARVPYPGDPHSYYSFAAQALSKGGLTPMQQQALYQQQMNAYQQHYGAGSYNSTPSIPYGKFFDWYANSVDFARKSRKKRA